MRESAPSKAIAPSGFFALRAPLLPFDALQDRAGDGSEAAPAGDGAAGSRDGGTADYTRARLRDAFASVEVREALFIASPDLEEQLDGWRPAPDGESDPKVERALVRYFARMAGRATPFGLFAGCSVGTVGTSTRLAVGGAYRRHTRLDMDYVVALADALGRDAGLRPHLRFTANSSLYRVAGRARYTEIRRRDKGWSHHRAALTVPDYLKAVLGRASGGATPDELARALLDHDPEATESEAAEYVAELIEQQVLVSELAPAVTGPEPVHRLIERLRQLPAGAAAADRLTRVRDELAALDAGGLGASPNRYRAIAARLAELPAPADPSRLFQVDLVRPGDGVTLGENVIAEIVRGVELLRQLTPERVDDPLAAFREAFVSRFGDTTATREVLLAEALDDETGVGFGDRNETVESSSLLEGLPQSPPPPRRVAWGPRETYLLGRLTEVLARGDQELSLTAQDVERLASSEPAPSAPDAFAAVARLEAASGEAVDRGDFRLFLPSITGPSGARLLARFCHADPELAARVAEHLTAEEALRPSAAFAEIVHLPEGRLGNILVRPTCRPFEIPYLGRSGAPAEQQIPLSDLTVSVERARVVLRSKRLGREVVPRLTNAHNFGAAQGVYGFLCALQGQGVSEGLGWDWGPLAGSAFLPRVVCGRLVLARAQWRVAEAEVAPLLAGGEGDRPAAVRRWREARRLPRWVCLADFDNELPADLDNRLMIETLLREIKGREGATLVEQFPAPDLLCAAGPGGRYVHEVVVPFVTRREAGPETPRRQPPPARTAPATRRGRVFAPGSEWLTLKLYAGPITVDDLLRDVVGPLAVELVAGGPARRWFFVRYADPHWHLRLRFEGDPARLQAEALPRVQAAVAPLLADGRAWKLQCDTYEREIERYGGTLGIGQCEQLFHHDSETAVELLRLVDDDIRGDRRWRLTLLGMDRLLDDLGLDLEAKRAVSRRACDATRAELSADAGAKRVVAAKYRAESAALSGLLARDASGPEWAAARAALDRRSVRNAAPAALLRRHDRLGELSTPVVDVAGSLLHMHANRLLRSAHRAQETVLYDFLDRYYAGQAARASVQSPRDGSAAEVER